MFHCNKCTKNQYGVTMYKCWKCEVIDLLEDIKERL